MCKFWSLLWKKCWKSASVCPVLSLTLVLLDSLVRAFLSICIRWILHFSVKESFRTLEERESFGVQVHLWHSAWTGECIPSDLGSTAALAQSRICPASLQPGFVTSLGQRSWNAQQPVPSDVQELNEHLHVQAVPGALQGAQRDGGRILSCSSPC